MASPVDDQSNLKRSRIVTLGHKLADDGAHYLWGAQGDKPGSGGVALATPVLDPDHPENTIFCAATLNRLVCAGRFRNRGFYAQLPAQKVWDRVNPKGRDEVLAFINKFKANPDAQRGWGFDLTPRVLSGYTQKSSYPTDFVGGGDVNNKLVWGEGCDDTQHFDCAGFIRYIVQQVCGATIGDDIDNIPSKKNSVGQPFGSEVQAGDDLLPGDILLYGGHYAFADSGNGKYPSDSKTKLKVVQAESAVFGVTYGSRGGQIKCIRLSPSTLLGRAV